MADVALVEQRLRQGLFYAAADAVRPLDASQAGDPWRLALAAEAYERTGRTAEATTAVADVCRRGPMATRALARALMVRGVLELEQGHADDSIETLERSHAVASQVGSPAEACWSQLRLLLSRLDAEPKLDLDAAVSHTRVAVERFGDANAAVALHVFASEAYARRGDLPPARRHLTTAQDLLRLTDNPWLGGLAAIGGFCVSYLEMDYASAESFAEAGPSAVAHLGPPAQRVCCHHRPRARVDSLRAPGRCGADAAAGLEHVRPEPAMPRLRAGRAGAARTAPRQHGQQPASGG